MQSPHMIFAHQTQLVTLANVSVGSLVLASGYDQSSVAALVCEFENEKCLLRVGQNCHVFQDNFGSDLLDLGAAVAKFDPGSAASNDAFPRSGALLITAEGPGVFEAAGRIGSSGGYLTLLNGVRQHFYRSRGIPTFCRWELGIVRDNEFVSVAIFDLTQDA
ncbi:hypothetical protein [Novosphingobium sp. B1]|uniref:hypothetical protein n=1 Tax=Novosphingobium sp. B1 TaxID=1938756 RepID=UPI001C385F39|nr:hypothetical protein [Novosphingobium sp. B1]